MAESREELKSILIKVKEESEKAGLKLNIQKIRSWHLVPSLHGKQTGKQWKQWQTILGGSKCTVDGDCNHEIKRRGGRNQNGGGIGRGDHFLFYKFIERTTERWTKFTKQLLIASSGHQAPRKAVHCLRREVGQGYWRSKRETRERGTETHPGKGVLIEEVSNHQETLALAGPGEALKSWRAT